MNITINIEDLSKETIIKYLKDLIWKLDTMDQNDVFGTEGWRHRFGLEDF